jgi:hypothetical protein
MPPNSNFCSSGIDWFLYTIRGFSLYIYRSEKLRLKKGKEKGNESIKIQIISSFRICSWQLQAFFMKEKKPQYLNFYNW